MITTRKENYIIKRAVAHELHSKGYISATALSAMSPDQLQSIGINAKRIDKPDIIKRMFEIEENVRAICVDYGGRKSYWYKKDDLVMMYGFTEKKVSQTLNPISKRHLTLQMGRLNAALMHIDDAAKLLLDYVEAAGKDSKDPVLTHVFALREHVNHLKGSK